MNRFPSRPFRPSERRPRLASLLALPLALLVGSLLGSSTPAESNTVTNDPIPVGTSWGNPTESPGDPMFTEDGIHLTIWEFFSGGSPFFNQATITNPITGFGSSNLMNLNNVSVEFDFRELGDVECVRFEFADLGGSENIMVNRNGPPIEVQSLVDLDGVVVAPGVTMYVNVGPIQGGVAGVARLEGPIQAVRVGGQEFWMDNMSTNCEPDEPCPNLVSHESLNLGDCFGICSGHGPGDLIFVEDAIGVFLGEITYVTGGTGFNEAKVEAAFGGFGDGQIMQLNNIANIYRFDQLDCDVTEVTLSFRDSGGDANFQVNGGPLYIGDLFTDVPAQPTPGIFYTVSGNANNGQITLTGDAIQSVLIAGQEFWVDNVCARCGEPPEPCPNLIHHESLGAADCFGSCAGQVPGDFFFMESGIPVFGERFDHGGGIVFNDARVDAAFSGFGDGQVLALNNISLVYDLHNTCGTVAEVTFEFADLGGIENFQVNGGPLFVGDLDTVVPPNPAAGVTFSIVTSPIPGGIRGVVTLVGPVWRLLVGGQEFWIDNVCVRCENTVDVPDVGATGAGVFLSPVSPNPARPHATITFQLSESTPVDLAIYDVQGRRVASLITSAKPAGRHSVAWDGITDAGARAVSGVYFVRLVAGGSTATRRVQVLR